MQNSTPSSEQKDSLLLIEDDQKVCQAMVAYLEKHDYEVTAAMTGEAALKKVSSEVFDLVILDLNLPGLDGMEVLKNIRSRDNTPVLVVSARQGGKDRVRGSGPIAQASGVRRLNHRFSCASGLVPLFWIPV